jgi:ribosome-associated translation inhibitor RaiA
MQSPVQITFRNVERLEVVESLIHEKVAWLEKYHGRITSCKVVIEAPHRSHQRGNPFHVHIDLALPGFEIVVNRDP